ncbi:protein DpdE [Sulfurovum sp.]|uniref:protein DpdE n=1 Tax=Sulfurovum sp. TaxID=1969726 RepID=UPI0035651906
MPILLNNLVAVDNEFGIGKVISIDETHADVKFFLNITKQITETFLIDELQIVYLSPQTRVYVKDEDNHTWKIGRVIEFDDATNPAMDYKVRFPNKKEDWYASEELEVRCLLPLEDPTEILAYSGGESQYLHNVRSKVLKKSVELRAAAKGMTALTSSAIDFIPHQVDIVRRILSDNTQRYLLADEVGMGKTIEAGVIARQCLLDDEASRVLIIVPDHLINKWEQEMHARFYLEDFENRVDIVTPSEVKDKEYRLVIIDEAHHIIAEELEVHAAIKEVALKSTHLLLLSATPGIGQEQTLLDMLKLLDPALYAEETIEAFKIKLEKQIELGRFLRNLRVGQSKFMLKRILANPQDLFIDDQFALDLCKTILGKVEEADDFEAELRKLKNHILNTYRLHQRLIRTRRSDAEDWVFSDRGPEEFGDFSHVEIVYLDNKFLNDIYDLIDTYREEVSQDMQDQNTERIEQLCKNHLALLKLPYMQKEKAVTLLERLMVESKSSIEKEIIIAIHDAVGTNQFKYIDTMAKAVLKYALNFDSNVKLMAFISDKEIGEKFENSLNRLQPGFSINYDSIESVNISESEYFKEHSTARICICNQAAEEGVDFQYAKAMIHLDMPLKPSRIEQRIGRLDRYGRTGSTINHLVVLPTQNESHLWNNWLNLLKNGFNIFHQPISDIQLSLEKITNKMMIQLFQYGTLGLEDAFDKEGGREGELVEKLNEIIQQEREKLDEQYALNHLILEEDDALELAQEIEDAEYPESEIVDSFDKLLFDFLLFSRSQDDGYSFKVWWNDKRTLIPKQQFWTKNFSVVTDMWEDAFALGLERPLTYKRHVAVKHSNTSLLRPGHPFFSAIERFLNWEDRGTVFSTWRQEADFPEFIPRDNVWIAFKLNFVVEIKDDELGRDGSAFKRRCDGHIPPQYLSIYLDQDLNVINDEPIVEILDRPYDKQEGDENLSNRTHVLEHFIDANVLKTMCLDVHKNAKEILFQNGEFLTSFNTAKKDAIFDIKRRIQNIEARQKRDSSNTMLMAQELQFEHRIMEQLENPFIRLDSMGLFLISRWSISETRLFDE